MGLNAPAGTAFTSTITTFPQIKSSRVVALTEFSAVTGNFEQAENKINFIFARHQVFSFKEKALFYVNSTTPIDKIGHVVSSLKRPRSGVHLNRHISVEVHDSEDEICEGRKVSIVLLPFASSSEHWVGMSVCRSSQMKSRGKKSMTGKYKHNVNNNNAPTCRGWRQFRVD